MALCLAGCRRTPSLDGMWDATLTRGSTEVPFRFAIEGKGDNLNGSFFNGDDKITSTSASVHEQAGAEVSASIVRLDGDSGAATDSALYNTKRTLAVWATSAA
jgi:hypothetical protein